MSTLKRFILIAIILLIIGIIGSLLTVRALLTDIKFETTEQLFTETYDHVQINAQNMNIELYVSDNEETKIVSMIDTESEMVSNVEDETLFITIDEPKSTNFNMLNLGFSSKSPLLKVYLPDSVYNQVHVTTENGKIKAENLTVNDLSIKSSNGLVQLQDIKSKQSNIITTNGKIDLHHITGDIVGETVNGKIQYEIEAIEQNINFKTVNGLVSVITTTPPTNVTFDLSAELGKVDLFGEKNQHTVYGNGENLVKLTTSIGKVIVKHK